MRKPFLFRTSRKFLTVVIGLVLVSSVNGLDIEETHSCDEEFSCGSAQSPYKVGQQYFYSFESESNLLAVSRVFSDFVENDIGGKSITKNGSLMITPLNSCEILITLYDYEGESSESSETYLKVAFENGSIRRTCSSSKDSTDADTNVLRALSSLLQGNFDTSTNTVEFPEKINNNVILEDDSEGTCLTKYEQCSPTKFIKYKLMNYCSYSTDILQNIILKETDLTSKVEALRLLQTQNLCELSDMNSLEYIDALSLCIIEKNGEGAITSSYCKEENNQMNQDVVSLKLEKVGKNGTPPKDISFYVAGLGQQGGNFIVPTPQESPLTSDTVMQEIRSSVESLANVAERRGLNTLEVQQRFNKIKYAANKSPTELQSYLEELILSGGGTSGGVQEIVILLKVVAGEASNNEAILELLEKSLSNDLLLKELAKSDLESILRKIIRSTSSLNYINKKILKFSKFIVDFANENDDVSNSIKSSALATFTQHLELFCTRLRHMTQDNFCSKNALIHSWIQSLIVSKIEKEEKFSNKVELLEGFSTVQEHSNVLCKSLIDEKDSSQNLWIVLNCYRENACNKEGKTLYRTLLEDQAKSSSMRIAAFTSMMECVDDDDLDLIARIVRSEQPNDDEVAEYIKLYMENRISKLLLPEQSFLQNNETSLGPLFSSRNQAKSARASNTLVVVPITRSAIILMETNILYFEKAAMIPQLISGRIYLGSSLESSSYIVDSQNILQVDLFVDDTRGSDEFLNFHATAIVKVKDATVLKKDFSISQEALLQLAQLLQQKVQHAGHHDISWWIKQTLLKVVTEPLTVDLFELGSLGNGHRFYTTLSGIQQRAAWKLDGFARVSLTKDDCTDLLKSEKENVCQLNLKTDFSIDLSAYAAVGLGSLEEGFLVKSNLSGALPLSLAGLTVVGDKDGDQKKLEDRLKLTLPSSLLYLFGGHDHRLFAVEAVEKEITSSQLLSSMRMGISAGDQLEMERKSTMQIELRRIEKNVTLEITHPKYEVILETSQDPINTLVGRYTCLVDSARPKTFTFQVGAKNSENHKQLVAKVTRGGEEYLLDAYYIKEVEETDDHKNAYSFNCGGAERTGILCRWPFCFFCGVQYFVGATVSTPKFKNIKLLEGSITQEYPHKKLDVVFKTSGIPHVRNGELKLSLRSGHSAEVFTDSKLRDDIQSKLDQFLPNDESGNGDALSESESLASSSTYFSAYTLDSTLDFEVIGDSGLGLSLMYMSAHEHQNVDSLMVAGGGLFYPARGKAEKLSLFVTSHEPNITGTNISKEGFNKAYIRSTQFPLLDSDLSVHTQKFDATTLIKRSICLKPLNLIKGDIRVDSIDKAGNDDSILELFRSRDFSSNLHVDRTYKLFLPKNLRYHIYKGKILVKQTNGVLEEAALEAMIGFDHALELKYEFNEGDRGKSYKLLTSVIANGETYGLHHRIEPMPESAENDAENDDLITVSDDELQLQKRLYRGTYIFGEMAMKAHGIILAKKGREILPFSKFGIRTTFEDGKNAGPRIVGSETIHDEIHDMRIVIKKGDTNIFELKNEVNPSNQVPIKSSIAVKDYADVKIHQSSTSPNVRNLQMKAKWIPENKIITGKISFPPSPEVPTYDVEISIAKESDMDNPLFKIASISSVSFGSNSTVSSENTIQIRNSKWEFGLDAYHLLDDDVCYFCSNNRNASLSLHFVQPNLQKYSGTVAAHKRFKYGNGYDNWLKLYLNLQRPDVTPLVLHLESRDHIKTTESVENSIENDEEIRKELTTRNLKSIAHLCHKDNFLYVFPTVDIDYNVDSFKETKVELERRDSGKKGKITGKSGCTSKGIYVPLCDEVNLSYEVDFEYLFREFTPWWVNLTAVNEQPGLIDEVKINIAANYDSVKAVSPDFEDNYFGRSLFEDVLITAGRDNMLFKGIYNIDYDLQRKPTKGEETLFGVNGTYTFTKMYESINFFEFSDHLQWSHTDGKKLHIWTNLLNHSTDSNLTSGAGTFSSQYVSLGEERNEGGCSDSCNITWMELRTMLNSNGFGTIQTVFLNPSKILGASEGEIAADFLVRTEFSPLKTFRVLFSHDVYKNENEEDDDSEKYGALTKINGILNEVEISGTNSLTVAPGSMPGRLTGIGESLIGRLRSPSGIYEYFTFKAFAVVPSSLSYTEGDNLLHFDASSSWTNEDDDDTDLRIVTDVVYPIPFDAIPLARFAYFKNSTDLDLQQNGNLLIYQSGASRNPTGELRFPENIISDGIHEVSFTQVSLQSISQQIIDDYANVTSLSRSSTNDDESTIDPNDSQDYNFEIRSRSAVQSFSSSYALHARWVGFREKLYHCQSSLKTCEEDEENLVDTSNYCNLLVLPLKQLIYLSYFGL